ncbi:hypothetical protein OAF98_02075 [Planctomicrobium sp.]|nr:hypothetical protein [Planctomicrobium sp.]MDA7527451.1 hypothetical protein [bacterium]MDB4731292.1 hypothetical protein [bacterium]MDB4733376.1 hypothetical protein [Planctomicrobium sp.]MDB4743249.1 hypothetical protein [Planctomicrobium sp.]
MTFERRILHHGSSPTGTPVILSLQAVKKCWFELNRQGGCGAGELILSNEFFDRDQVEIGDWISFEYANDDRWYLGRIEERHSTSPAQVRLRLQGMSIQLNEVFPGGFGVAADGMKPHRYAANQQFTHDPDRDIETFDSVASATELVEKLIQQYVVPATQISFEPSLMEAPLQEAALNSLKVRGEESIRSILKELSTRAQGASWGVNEQGQFFFLRRTDQAVAAYREGVNLTDLSEIRDREHLFNRILLTGDYIYDRREQSDMIARRSYRWRGNFVEPISRASHGEKRIRLWLPWVRTQADSMAFAKEFFRTYSQPVSRFLIEVDSTETLPKPWAGRFAVYDKQGELLTFSYAETVRVIFDHTPRLRMELGPLDPRELWAEPPQDERWELPDQHLSAGGDVSLPPTLSIGAPPPPPDPPQPPLPPPPWSSYSSLESSDLSSLDSSGLYSSLNSSGPVSSWESSEEETVESSNGQGSSDSDSTSASAGSSGDESSLISSLQASDSSYTDSSAASEDSNNSESSINGSSGGTDYSSNLGSSDFSSSGQQTSSNNSSLTTSSSVQTSSAEFSESGELSGSEQLSSNLSNPSDAGTTHTDTASTAGSASGSSLGTNGTSWSSQNQYSSSYPLWSSESDFYSET